jgi:hypothetical protein
VVTGPAGTVDDTQPVVVTFQPVAGATGYEVQVQDANGNVVFDQAGLPANQTSFTLPTPLADGDYQVLVQASNATGAGPWSDAVAFTVDATAVPGQPVVTGPTDTVDDTQPITVTFQPAAGATGYEVQVQDANGNVVFDQAGLPANQTSVTLPAQLADGTYQVLVQATNAAGQTGAWSDAVTFTVAPPGQAPVFTQYQLTPTGDLQGLVNGTFVTIDSNIQSFAVAADGTLFGLDTSGNLYSYQNGVRSADPYDTDVQAIAQAGDGTVFELQASGNLYAYRNGAWSTTPDDTEVQAIAASPDGTVYNLEASGNLYAYQNGTYNYVDTNVLGISINNDGTLQEQV